MSSKIDQLKASKRQQQSVQQKAMFPDGLPGETNENQNKSSNELKNERTDERMNLTSNEPTNESFDETIATRRRFSFDLRPELHKELKMVALVEDRNMYEIVEDLIEGYLSERKNVRT